MAKGARVSLVDFLLAFVFLCFFLILYGALPFIGIPTLGQALWSSSFAQSFANHGLFDFYADNIGSPGKAAMAFGLAGAWIQSLFIRVGFFPADAYSLMCAFWIVVAYAAAYKIASRFCKDRRLSIITAAVWVSMPVCWGHTAFSMLAFGMLLLPLYYLSSINLRDCESSSLIEYLKKSVAHSMCCILAVFMDGYTFMMFALGCFSLLAIEFFLIKHSRMFLLKRCLPVHLAAFALAYYLYSRYVGVSYADGNYNGYFSITGLNVFNLLVPQQGVSWIFEAAGIGVPAVGDIRMTAFSAPIIFLALYMCVRSRRGVDGLSKGALLVFVVALFLSFGPHMQFPRFSQVNFSEISVSLTSFAFERFYLIPTGSEFIYKYLPGFNSMRVTFRWIALAIFMLWLFVAINVRKVDSGNGKVAFFLLLSIVISTPNLSKWVDYSTGQRDLFLEVESKFVIPLGQSIRQSEVVAFVPWTNDMVVPYAASRGGYVTLNIAGDKNIMSAKASWPVNFNAFGHMLMKNITAADAPKVSSILLAGEADVVVVPNIAKLLSLQELPCMAINVSDEALKKSKPRGEGFICPSQMMSNNPAIVAALRSDSRLDISENGYFTLARLRIN